MHVKVPSGISTSTSFRLLPRAPNSPSLPFRPFRRAVGRPHGHRARQILGGERGRVGQHLGGGALRDDLAAVDAGARADIDHVIGLQDRVLVVLDHDHRVAEVAQALERAEQPLVVALVQADRGLVQHVEHAGEAGADLRGQPDALALAARERAGAAGQRQVFEADIHQEAQPVADLLEDADRDLVLLRASASPAAPRTSDAPRRPRARSRRRCRPWRPSRPAPRASAACRRRPRRASRS